MATETITLELDADAAQVFKSAAASEREKLSALFGFWLKEYTRADVASLKDTMDEISAQAQSRGLTPEVLAAILEAE